MIERYPSLVEAAIEFKRFSRKLLAEKSKTSKVKLAGDSIQKYEIKKGLAAQNAQNFNEKGEYEESKSARETDMADGYRLEYDAADDKYYCLLERQTSKSLLFYLLLM